MAPAGSRSLSLKPERDGLVAVLLRVARQCVVIRPALARLRMTQSVSFRITRTAEDVAQMLNALSQRLVKLEQRLESLELQVRQQRSEAETMPAEERQRLDDVDQLLLDCQELLNSTELGSDAASDPAGMLSQPSTSESEFEAAAA